MIHALVEAEKNIRIAVEETVEVVNICMQHEVKGQVE